MASVPVRGSKPPSPTLVDATHTRATPSIAHPKSAHVWVMLVADTLIAGQVFVKVPLASGDDVADVSKRACEVLDLGAGASARCRLFFAAAGGEDERVRTIMREPYIAAGILRTEPLFASDAVVADSWLLARVLPPPATVIGA